MPPRLLIQTMIMAPEACQHVRVLEPDRLLASIPGVRTVAELRTARLNIAQPDEGKVFIFQRAIQSPQRDAAAFANLVARGYLVIAEYDDLPSRWPGNVQSNYFCLRAAHAVQTSTPTLADWIRRHNPHVAVFENQLAELPPSRDDLDNEPIRVFFGALNREQDWAPLIGALDRVIAAAGARVHVEVIHDRRFFDALSTTHKSFTPMCEQQQYHAIAHRCHLGLLPLSDNEFNRCKSDLKFLELAGHSVACLASPTVYEATVQHQRTGLICRDAAQFAAGLQRLIDDGPLRRRLGESARAWVAQHRLLSQHYQRRYEWYGQLLQRLPDLEHQRQARLNG